MTRIVIVGGGAGGLGLATQLGHKLGKKKKAEIILVDKNRTHIWKPLLHEVAAGSLDAGVDELSYRAHAKSHGFQFQRGALTGLDRENKTISLGQVLDAEGNEILGARELSYDFLVMALGSISNDFNTPGVRDNCIFLDSPQQAERFHDRMLSKFYRLGSKQMDEVKVAIVGAGATGVELSAELYNSLNQIKSYGFEDLDPASLKLSLVEAGQTILPALPERISSATHSELEKLGVKVMTNTRVTEASEKGLHTLDGNLIEADLMVWAAGIKAPDFMKEIGGLETNRINQLVVNPNLTTTLDDSIYALGDCAACPQPDGSQVPPRAQSAHQMASCIQHNILARLNGKEQKDYIYKDHGSLVSLSKFSTVGSLMGNLTKGSMMVEGRMARVVYVSLYRMHQISLHGYFKTGLITFVEQINRILRPGLKLH